MTEESRISRRTALKGIGATGAAAAAGGASLVALTGGAAAKVVAFNLASPSSFSTTDGELHAVGYTFDPLVFEWSGLNTDAQWGGVRGNITVEDGNGNQIGSISTAWDAGQLGENPDGSSDTDTDDSDTIFDGDADADAYLGGGGDSETDGWGGPNDGNTGPGKDGTFYFDFGGENNGAGPQRVYLITGTTQDGNDYIDSSLQYATLDSQIPASDYPVPSDGNSVTIVVTVELECAVFDGDPTADGTTKLASETGSDSFSFDVTNENTSQSLEASGTGYGG